MKEIVRLLFNLRLVIQISSFRMVNLLCSGGHFSNITFINAKTKYESPYLLDVSQPYLQNHLRMSLGRPQDVGSTRSLELNIRPYWHIIITSAGGVLKMSVGNVLWHYIQDSTGTFFGCYIGTSSCRHISYVRRMSAEDVFRTLSGDVVWRYIQDHMVTSIERLLGTSSGRNFAK